MSQSSDPTSPDHSPIPRQRRRFTESFKRDAVRLITHEQYSFMAAAQAVGVSDNSLRLWHNNTHRNPNHATRTQRPNN